MVDRSNHYVSGYTYILRIDGVLYRPTGHEKALKGATNAQDIFYPYYDMPISLLSGKDVGITIINSVNEFVLDYRPFLMLKGITLNFGFLILLVMFIQLPKVVLLVVFTLPSLLKF